MSAGGRRRTLVRAVVLVLAAVSVIALPHGVQAAEGNPSITAPADSSIQYEGFAGPFKVDLSNAPAGEYDYYVGRMTPELQIEVIDPGGTITWSGTGAGTYTRYTGVIPAGQDYFFTISDGGGHTATSYFTVRDYPRPRCSVIVPTKVRLNQAAEIITGRLTSSCAAADISYASWDYTHVSQGYANSLVFEANTTDSLPLYDVHALGTYVAVPNAAFNPAGDDIALNRPSTIVRVDSRVSLTAVRDGDYVSLRTSLTKYVRAANGFGPWGKHTVQLSYRTCTACAWKLLASPTTSSQGRTSTRVKAPAARDYRATSAGTSFIWNPLSDYVRR